MSYWVTLTGAGPVPRFTEGMGRQPTEDASLNVTYNYAGNYGALGFSLRDLDGRRSGDAIEEMERLVLALGTVQDANYWAATDGNAGHALNILLGWARQYPDGVWEVS